MNHRIMYLKGEFGVLVGCVAIKEHAALDGASNVIVEYRLSVVNPHDVFDKDVARQLAVGRLVEGPYTVKLKRSCTMHDVSAAIMKDISRDSNAPSRARKAAKLWLRKSGR